MTTRYIVVQGSVFDEPDMVALYGVKDGVLEGYVDADTYSEMWDGFLETTHGKELAKEFAKDPALIVAARLSSYTNYDAREVGDDFDASEAEAEYESLVQRASDKALIRREILG
jgi:hypothetical protein